MRRKLIQPGTRVDLHQLLRGRSWLPPPKSGAGPLRAAPGPACNADSLALLARRADRCDLRWLGWLAPVAGGVGYLGMTDWKVSRHFLQSRDDDHIKWCCRRINDKRHGSVFPKRAQVAKNRIAFAKRWHSR